MIKVINISAQVLGLTFNSEQGPLQTNVQPGDYIIVNEVTPQIKHLADPSKNTLKLMKEEEIYG